MNWIEELKNYTCYNEAENQDKNLILSALNTYDNLLTRDNIIMHMTASGYILNKEKDKVLMIYHKIYDSWAWTGGHADGESDLLKVALKEAREETGLKNIKPIMENLFSLEVLTVNGHIKKNKYVSSHLHLNFTYLLEADEKDSLIVNEEETKGVQWISLDKIAEYSTESYIINNIYNKLNKKIKETFFKN